MGEVIGILSRIETLYLDQLTPALQDLVKDKFQSQQLPKEVAIPDGATLAYEKRGNSDVTLVSLEGCQILFDGRLTEFPTISIYWKPGITVSGNILAIPSFGTGRAYGNPFLIGADSNMLSALGITERIIANVGPLEQILPDTFGTLKPLGVDLSKYDLRDRVGQVRGQIFLALQHLRKNK